MPQRKIDSPSSDGAQLVASLLARIDGLMAQIAARDERIDELLAQLKALNARIAATYSERQRLGSVETPLPKPPKIRDISTETGFPSMFWWGSRVGACLPLGKHVGTNTEHRKGRSSRGHHSRSVWENAAT
jgi:hypothetical protein